MSHPSRDVWIEIMSVKIGEHEYTSHIPHGMCGLKSPGLPGGNNVYTSHPSRDVWIEMRL